MYLINITTKSILILFILFATSCISYNLTSPEENYKTIHKAIKTKNYSLFKKCFYIDGNLNKEENIKNLADEIFKKNIINYKIIEKNIINENETFLIIEETYRTDKGSDIIVTYKVKYIRDNNEWKTISSETMNRVIKKTGQHSKK